VNRWLIRAALAGAGLLAAASTGPADEPADLPLESEGDLRFFLDVSAYRAAEGLSEIEIYVALTNDQIRFEGEEEGPLESELALEAVVRDPEGEEVHSSRSILGPQVASGLDAADRGIVQVIREKARLEPGDYHLALQIRDEKALREGLFNRMRNAKREGRVEAWIRVPDLGGDGLVLSDLTLTRGVRPAEPGSPFGRYGVDFDANPSRYYGLALPTLSTYLEVYGGEEFQPGDTYLVRTSLQDRSGTTLEERVHRAGPASSAFVATGTLEVSPRLTAGGYRVEVTVLHERTGTEAVRRRDIEVLWGSYSWGRDPDEVLQEMRLIMSDSEHETLRNLSPGAREVYLAEFWHGLDPDPAVAGNEVLQEFMVRIRIADREFRSTLQRGILTDRGRVFVRYGPPDDVSTQYNSSSYGLDPALERVADPSERATLSARPDQSFLDADEYREGDVSGVTRQRGSATIKSKELQIWTYDGRGHPLTDRIPFNANSHRGLKFIFADEMGNGEFQLIGSTGAVLP
jgi:GWxTD domain-containing protein